jgi:hypothetical protein
MQNANKKSAPGPKPENAHVGGRTLICNRAAADIQLDTHTCVHEWFDEWKRIEVVANVGQYPLLGVGLLLDHDLQIDYRAKTSTVG